MANENEVGTSQTDIEFEPEEDDGKGFVIEENPSADPLGGKTPEQLLAELKAKDEETTRLKSQADSTAALAGAFGALGERLEKAVNRPQQQQQPQQAPQAPAETDEAFRERMRIKQLEDPVGMNIEIFNRYYGGLVHAQRSATTTTSKQLLMLDPEKKSIYEKYASEVEALAVQQLGSPTAYQDAVDRVAATHMNDLVAIKVERAVQEALAKAGLAPQSAAAQGSASPSARAFTETAAPKAPVSKNQKLSITVAQYEKYKAEARAQQMDVDQYIDLFVRQY